MSHIEGGEVHARHGQKASIAGLVTCGSVWVCPVCSAVIAAQRAAELQKLVEWNAARNGSLALLTLTMRHHRGHTLPDLRKGLQNAWRHVTKSRAWSDAKKDHGIDGYVRAIEATHGTNGWHLHMHVLLIFEGTVTDLDAAMLEPVLWQLWSTGLAREGFEAVREHAVDVRRGTHALETLGQYLNKIVFEAVGGRWKQGRGGGRTPFQILADAMSTPAPDNADDLALWLAWEQGSKGMRQLWWTPGLKARVGVDDLSDEELAEREQPGTTFAILPRQTWREVHPQVEHFLDATEAGGPDAGLAWLTVRGLEHRPVVDGFAGETTDDAPADVMADRVRERTGTARRNDAVDALLDRVRRHGPAPEQLDGDPDQDRPEPAAPARPAATTDPGAASKAARVLFQQAEQAIGRPVGHLDAELTADEQEALAARYAAELAEHCRTHGNAWDRRGAGSDVRN